MINEEPQCIVIDIPKPRIYKLTSVKNAKAPSKVRNEMKSCSRASTNKFSIQNEEILSANELKKTHLILPFKLYTKTQGTRSFKQRINFSVSERYKIVFNDFYKRIHTEDPKNDVFSITNIDKDFFSCISGTRLNHKFSYKSYKLLLKDLLRTRHAIGFATDCILNFEVNHKNELRSHDSSIKRFTDQVTYLDIFISEGYQKSMELLGKWEKLKFAVDSKVKELQNLGIEKFTTMSRLITLDSIYNIQLKYGRFLYYLSPPRWRLAHRDFARSIEIEQKGFDLGKSMDDDAFDVLFDKLYGICFGTAVKPVIYFTKPCDLINIFSTMEEQQLYYFTHVNYLAPFITILNDKIQILKDVTISDTASILRHAKYLKYKLQLNEDRCFNLKKKFFKILHGLFFDSTAATDVLKLNFNLQYCFERVFGETPSHMDIVAVAKSLEKSYMDYSLILDTIQSNTIRRTVQKYSEKERLKFKKAKIAKTELRLFDRLEQQLLRTYNFPTKDKRIPITKKIEQRKKTICKSQLHKHEINENNDFTLSEAELEYLTLFTEWTNSENPDKYLQGLNLSEDTNKGFNNK